ncbi:MAG: hypothetical protein ACREBW_01525 [Candidatus Micrarchaeaceae archaeon]
MANNTASNYTGSRRGGANIKAQGQTSGPYGNDPSIRSSQTDKGDPKPLKP